MKKGILFRCRKTAAVAVSYTHLDVYKRQDFYISLSYMRVAYQSGWWGIFIVENKIGRAHV